MGRERAAKFVPHLALILFGAWQVLCFSDNVQMLLDQPRRFPSVTWPATWQMFTRNSAKQESVFFEGRFDLVWVRLPMDEWLPARWESGFRWEAASKSPSRLPPFLAFACHHSSAEEVRMVRYRWPRKLGSSAQFVRDADVDVRGARRCP